MPYNSYNYTFSHAPIRQIKMVGTHFERKLSNWLDSSYIPVNTETGEKLARPGMILAIDSDTNKYVPYNSGASYGTGSDTAVAVLDTLEDVTLGDVGIAPIYSGQLIESFCYILGGEEGTVSAGVKTALDEIEWV